MAEPMEIEFEESVDRTTTTMEDATSNTEKEKKEYLIHRRQ